jgi:hypothetical protein
LGLGLTAKGKDRLALFIESNFKDGNQYQQARGLKQTLFNQDGLLLYKLAYQNNTMQPQDIVRKTNAILENEDTSPAVKYYLTQLNAILWDSKQPINPVTLNQALQLIETIPIKSAVRGFFTLKNADMVERLREHKQPTVNQTAPPTAIKGPEVSSKEYPLFERIHQDLRQIRPEVLQFTDSAEIRAKIKAPKPAWKHDYPREEGQVMNNYIGGWQTSESTTNESKNEHTAYVDFQRDTSIRGMRGKEDDEVTDLLSYLIKDTKYPDDKKEQVMHWLQEKGGQGLHDFIKKMIREYGPEAFMNAETLSFDWTIEKGELVCNYEMVINSLIMDDGMKINNGKGELVEVGMRFDPSNATPIMQVKAQFGVVIDENSVFPKMNNLQVTSYCPALIKPENTDELEDSNTNVI